MSVKNLTLPFPCILILCIDIVSTFIDTLPFSVITQIALAYICILILKYVAHTFEERSLGVHIACQFVAPPAILAIVHTFKKYTSCDIKSNHHSWREHVWKK